MKTKMMIWGIIFCGSFQKGVTQCSAGAEQYCSAMEEQSFSTVQVEWYQHKKWYAEARYNYEALNSFSLNAGRSYEGKGLVSYYVCPMAGVVWGNLHAGSVGFYTDISYKKISFHTQSQYTFSIADRSENFIYSWSELGYQAFKNLDIGMLIQQINPISPKSSLQKGLFIKFECRNWSFPLYAFDLTTNNRSLVVGISFQKELKK